MTRSEKAAETRRRNKESATRTAKAQAETRGREQIPRRLPVITVATRVTHPHWTAILQDNLIVGVGPATPEGLEGCEESAKELRAVQRRRSRAFIFENGSPEDTYVFCSQPW